VCKSKISNLSMVMLQLVAKSGPSLKNTQFKNCISDYQGGAVAVIDTKDSVNNSIYLKKLSKTVPLRAAVCLQECLMSRLKDADSSSTWLLEAGAVSLPKTGSRCHRYLHDCIRE
jgi:hypothetical protein